MPYKKDSLNILVIVLFVLFLSLPFINKAVHIDDTVFLYMAKQILKDPLRPYSFNLDWSVYSGMAIFVADPPLVPYYISIIMKIFGQNEMIIHLSFVVFPLAAALSMYYISKKFTKNPLFATLFLVTGVVFVVMSHDLMLDIPFLALFLLSVALFIYGVDSGRKGMLLAGAVFCGFAYLAKYTGIAVFPVLGMYTILRKKPKYAFYLSIPAMMALSWNFYTYKVYGVFHNVQILGWLLGSQGSFSFQAPIIRLATNMTYIGGAMVFPLMLLHPFIKEKINRIASLVIGAFALAASIILYKISANFSYRYNAPQLALFWLFFSLGIFVFYLIARRIFGVLAKAIKEKRFNEMLNEEYSSSIFLFSWLSIVFLLNTFFAGGAARYATILVPPIAIFYFNIVENYKFFSKKTFKKFVMAGIALSAVLSAVVAYADYEYAGAYRNFSQSAWKYENGNKIWFAGHHGFQYYMENEGYTILKPSDNSPKKGDIIIRAKIPSPRAISPLLAKRLALMDTVSYEGSIPLRIHNPKARAGFYTFGSGFLPYSFSNASLEDFEVFRVVG